MTGPVIYAFSDEADPSLAGQIAALQRNGLRGMEIRGVDGENISEISLDKAREIRMKLDDAGLAVWSIGSPVGKIGIEDAFGPHLDVLRHTLELARVLGAANLRMFSFYLPAGAPPERYRSQVLERLECMAQTARGSGVRLCHENEKGIYGDIALRCLDIHRSVPELAGVFDPANFIQCGQDPAEAWALLKDHVKYLHVKDATASGEVVPAGRGVGSLPAILRDYLARGGREMTVEPHLRVFEGLAALERGGGEGVDGCVYASGGEAFDAAVRALKALLEEGSE